MKLSYKNALQAVLLGTTLASCAQPPSPEGIITATGRECLAGDLTNYRNPRREGPLTIVVEAPPYTQETRIVDTVTKTTTYEEEVELGPQDGRLSEWWKGEHYTTATYTVHDRQTGTTLTETTEETYVNGDELFCVDSNGNVYRLDIGPIFGFGKGKERG